MDIEVSFPGGKRVDARCGDFNVKTDQPQELGGDGSAIAPYDLFLASVATCAGVYVLGFCQARGLPTEGLALVQRHEVDPTTQLVGRIRLELTLPKAFPGDPASRGRVQSQEDDCRCAIRRSCDRRSSGAARRRRNLRSHVSTHHVFYMS
jgi:ribosomal protein S12 methylthiotransferase accessory factor